MCYTIIIFTIVIMMTNVSYRLILKYKQHTSHTCMKIVSTPFHNTWHFNLTICFQNWSIQLNLKITWWCWSLTKIKVAIVKNKTIMFQTRLVLFQYFVNFRPFRFSWFRSSQFLNSRSVHPN